MWFVDWFDIDFYMFYFIIFNLFYIDKILEIKKYWIKDYIALLCNLGFVTLWIM